MMHSKYVDSKITDHQRVLFDQYRQMMIGRVGTVMNGWRTFDLLDDDEVTIFIVGLLATGDHEAICRFESEVFLHGNDPKTYMRRQVIVTSKATIELGDEVMNKATVFAGEPNCGGVAGHDGCRASTSFYSPSANMEHPAIALEFFQRKQAEYQKAGVFKCCGRK